MDLSKIIDDALYKACNNLPLDTPSTSNLNGLLADKAKTYQLLINYSAILLEEYHAALKLELSKQGINI